MARVVNSLGLEKAQIISRFELRTAGFDQDNMANPARQTNG